MQEKLSLSLGVATSLGAYFLNEFFSLSNRFKNPAFVIVRDDQMGWIQHAIPNTQCTKLGFHTVETLLQFVSPRRDQGKKQLCDSHSVPPSSSCRFSGLCPGPGSSETSSLPPVAM